MGYSTLDALHDYLLICPALELVAKSLLVHLIVRANVRKQFSTFASQQRLAADIGAKDARTIRIHLRALRDAGWITYEDFPPSTRQRRYIFLNTQKLAAEAKAIKVIRDAKCEAADEPIINPLGVASLDDVDEVSAAPEPAKPAEMALSKERMALERNAFIDSLHAFPELVERLGEQGMQSVSRAAMKLGSEIERIYALHKLRDRVDSIIAARNPVAYIITLLRKEISDARKTERNPMSTKLREDIRLTADLVREHGYGWIDLGNENDLPWLEATGAALRKDLAGYLEQDTFCVRRFEDGVHLVHVLTDSPTTFEPEPEPNPMDEPDTYDPDEVFEPGWEEPVYPE